MRWLALAGDVMLGRGVRPSLHSMKADEPWGDVLPLLHAADVRIVNLECAITDRRRRWQPTPKVFYFRGDIRALDVLRAARIDGCSLANNHTLDFEVEGLLDTLHHLDSAGIRHAGAGRNREEAERPALLPQGVGLVAFTDNEAPFAAGPDRPGTAFIEVGDAALAPAGAAIDAARAAGARTVVFSIHWGPNMRLRPPPHFRRFARAVIDRGADVFYGHSAHVPQGVEVYRGRPILYDTGDFLDDYAVDEELRNDLSFLFLVCLRDGVPCELRLEPVHLGYAHVHRARGRERDRLLRREIELSEELGTRLSREEGALALRWEPSAGRQAAPARPPA